LLAPGLVAASGVNTVESKLIDKLQYNGLRCIDCPDRTRDLRRGSPVEPEQSGLNLNNNRTRSVTRTPY
jgi:hypothetical protein